MDPLSLVFFFLFLVSKNISQGLTHPQPSSQYAHISSNRSERDKDQINTLHHLRTWTDIGEVYVESRIPRNMEKNKSDGETFSNENNYKYSNFESTIKPLEIRATDYPIEHTDLQFTEVPGDSSKFTGVPEDSFNPDNIFQFTNIPRETLPQEKYEETQNVSPTLEKLKDIKFIKVPGVSSQQRLPVPPDMQQYYKEKVGSGRRVGRQIVPGVYSCGHQGSDTFINMINPHYPSHDRVAGTCQFRMLVEDSSVCQVRVDFVDTEMLAPTAGDCKDQYLVVSGSIWPSGFHRLCGINPDQHFYLHLDKDIGFQHLDFTITSVSSGIPYKFGLWITQISCGTDSSVMAPAGCTQYHFGNQGSLKSFNFEGVQYLNNQNYKICIRSEQGACFGEFRADTNQFMLEPVQQSSTSKNKRMKGGSGIALSAAGDENCARDYLLIPGGTSNLTLSKNTLSIDRYCGGFLNPKNGEEIGASVYSRISSSVFWVQFVTGRPDIEDHPNNLHGPGVRLRYFQIKNCLNTDLFN